MRRRQRPSGGLPPYWDTGDWPQDRLRAARWATLALKAPGAVVLDTETTGTGTESDSPRMVEVAVMDMTGAVLLNQLVNPGIPIPREATAVHGITDGDVAEAAPFAQLFPQLSALLEGRVCLAYNMPFDRKVLVDEVALHLHAQRGSPAVQRWLASIAFFDVLVPYSAFAGERPHNGAGYLWQPLGGEHRAVGDCYALLEALTAMSREAH